MRQRFHLPAHSTHQSSRGWRRELRAREATGVVAGDIVAPRIAQMIGWRNVFGVILIPVVIVWILFFFLAKNAPGERKVKMGPTMRRF